MLEATTDNHESRGPLSSRLIRLRSLGPSASRGYPDEAAWSSIAPALELHLGGVIKGRESMTRRCARPSVVPLLPEGGMTAQGMTRQGGSCEDWVLSAGPLAGH